MNCESPESIKITRICALNQSFPDSISFLTSKKLLKDAQHSAAAAIIVSKDIAGLLKSPLLAVNSTEMALVTVLDVLYPEKKPAAAIEKTAAVDKTAKIGEGTYVGHHVFVGENAVIGKNCVIESGVHIGADVRIGDDARIGPNCVFHHGVIVGNRFVVFGNSTFGADGFRFVNIKGKYVKIKQIGTVVIGDDVEIGACTTIDRGGIGDTLIGDGCKLDNHIHIGHNCVLGKNVAIAGWAGVAGSTTIEDNVQVGGGCGLADHVTIGEGTILGGGTAVRTDIPAKSVYVGWDFCLPFPEFQKVRVNTKHVVHLNKYVRRIEELEKKLGKTNEG